MKITGDVAPVIVLTLIVFLIAFIVAVGAIADSKTTNDRIEHVQLEDGTKCVVYNNRGISCEWGEA